MGAVALGKRKGTDVGTIAAAAGLAGIVLGQYANFYVAIRSEEARAEVRSAAFQVEGFRELGPEQREVAVDLMHAEVITKIGFTDSLEGGDLVFLFLFGGIGILYGYRTAAGADEVSYVARDAPGAEDAGNPEEDLWKAWDHWDAPEGENTDKAENA